MPNDIFIGASNGGNNHLQVQSNHHNKSYSASVTNEYDDSKRTSAAKKHYQGVEIMSGERDKKFLSQTFGDEITFKFKMPATEIYLSQRSKQQNLNNQ